MLSLTDEAIEYLFVLRDHVGSALSDEACFRLIWETDGVRGQKRHKLFNTS